MFKCRFLVVVATVATCRAHAQISPVELAQTIVQRWSAGSEADFAAVYPFREGRDARSEAVRWQLVRKPGLAHVIRTSGDRAVLLLSGVPLGFNSGDDTISTRGFSGVYEARSEDGRWKLSARIPLDDMGRILAHHMRVSVRPAFGISVEDRMRVQVKGNNGFAARLNHAAKLEEVSVAGRGAVHFFGGGLLWTDLPPGETELTVKYSIEVEEGPNNTNSGCFLKKAGHVRNQYFWHPFFDFNSAGDRADFDIEARIAKQYQVSTSIPQTGRVEGKERVIRGQTIGPAFALTLVYDRDWKVASESFGQTRLELFLTPQFQPGAEAIGREFRSVYELLSRRFGVPRSGYFGVVEARSKEGNGWHFASNQIVVAAGWPRVVSSNDNRPRAYLGHEISHLWTHGAGPAANFLREGWATYAESLILEKEFGSDTVKTFWKYQADDYLRQFDGKASLLEDENNSGVAYSKGAWLFRMLKDAMSSDAFQRTIAEYSRRSRAQPSGWETLAECAQPYAPPDFDARAFLWPWLAGKQAPHLTAEAQGRSVIIRQGSPYFFLPVTIEVSTAQGAERHRLWIKGPETIVTFSGDPSDVRIDPDKSLLLRR